MNREPDLRSSNLRPRNAERWVKIAFYAGLLLVVAWVYFTASGDANSSKSDPADKDQPSTSASTDSSGRQRTNSGRRPRSSEPRGTSDSSSDRENKLPSGDAEERDERRDSTLVVHDVRIPNEDGKIIYRGDVDLRPTLERIERGVRLRFPHDGIVFENRERRLPSKPNDYYLEFVLPTPGDKGPGGQRIVRGGDGEVYYSPDHYRSFRRVQ